MTPTTIYFIAPTRTTHWRVVKTTADKTHPRSWRGPFYSEDSAQNAALTRHQMADPHCTCNDCIAELAEDGTPEDDEPDEPEESDLMTEDYRKWYQDGLLVLEQDNDTRWTYRRNRTSAWLFLGNVGENHETAVREYCNRTQFWPNVWRLSDHGNWHLLTIHNTGEKKS
jgi:hypothetical protein